MSKLVIPSDRTRMPRDSQNHSSVQALHPECYTEDPDSHTYYRGSRLPYILPKIQTPIHTYPQVHADDACMHTYMHAYIHAYMHTRISTHAFRTSHLFF